MYLPATNALSDPSVKFMFITLEGIDGSGTTTQVALLAQLLAEEGRSCTTTFEPSNGEIGRLLRDALQRKVLQHDADGPDHRMLALLFAADRIDHLRRVVEPALARGEVVISDRYVHSSLAYQGASLEPRWVDAINAKARTADLVIWLDVPVEVCLERVTSRGGVREIFESEETLMAVKQRYEHAMHLRPERVVRVDGQGAPQKVAQRLLEVVHAHLTRAD